MRNGFTLLELLVVLVIVALASALVGPKLVGSMSNLNLRTASKKISASLRWARSQATSESATYTAVFDFDKNRVSVVNVQEESEKDPEESPAGDEEDPVKSRSYNLPDGVSLEKALSGEEEFDSGVFEMVFFPSGSSSGGDVILANDRGNQYSISVDFITGTVRLSEMDD